MKWFLTFIYTFSFVFAQTNIDSVLNKIKNQPDTAKITYLNKVCWSNRSLDSKFALSCGEKALEISRRIKDKRSEAKSLNLVGVIFRGRGDYDKSLAYFLNALGVAEEGKDSTEIAFAHNNIGGTYRLKFYNTLALEHIFKGLRIFENQKNKSGMAFCCINIGFIYDRQFNFPKALEYFQLSYNLRKEIGDKGGQGISLYWVAAVFADMGDYKTAKEKFLEAEKIYIAIGDKSGIASIWQGIAALLIRQKEYKEAVNFATNAINLSHKSGGAENEIKNKVSLGICYSNLHRYDEAQKILQSAIEQAGKIKDDYLKLKCLDAYSKMFEIKGENLQALNYARMYNALKDSVIRQENISSVGEMEAIFNTQQARRENALLHKNIELSSNLRTYWIIITILLILISFVTYGRYLFKKKANKELQQLNAMKDKFFGIIAHDLKNPFSSIVGLLSILREDFEEMTDDDKLNLIIEIEKAGKQTYRLLENLLFWAMTQTGNLACEPKELDMNSIIDETFELLETNTKNKNISLVKESSGDEKVYADEKMIKTVVRNLVSNGIKFTHNGGKVSVKINKVEKRDEIIVEDTGIGIADIAKEKLFSIDNVGTTQGTNGEYGTGLGLILCKEFIEKNGGDIKVESEIGKGSKFIFTLPSRN